MSTAALPSTKLSSHLKEQFERTGYLGPFDLFTDEKERSQWLKRCKAGLSNQLLPHPLARHAAVKAMAQLGMHPAFVQPLTELIGPDVIMWGSAVIAQAPGNSKSFHLDAEFTLAEGASVWLGLKNVVSHKTLSVIEGSHLVPISPQELKHYEGLDGNNHRSVLQAAQQYRPSCRLVNLDVNDGQFIIFHGRLWHATANVSTSHRYALNFRYAKASSPIRISGEGDLPHVKWRKLRTPCLMIRGESRPGVNRVLSVGEISTWKAWAKGLCLYLPQNVIRKLRRLV
jgi:hypothetical protein